MSEKELAFKKMSRKIASLTFALIQSATQGKMASFGRACGDCICPECGLKYSDHPFCPEYDENQRLIKSKLSGLTLTCRGDLLHL